MAIQKRRGEKRFSQKNGLEHRFTVGRGYKMYTPHEHFSKNIKQGTRYTPWNFLQGPTTHTFWKNVP